MASKNSFFCKCHEPTLQNPAQAEFWDKTPYICGTELCFCRLCNFDLPNKQRFSLQRHKALFGCVLNSWIVCFWLWHRALCWHQKILFFASATSQHFRIRHKPNSGIRRRIFVAQSFAFAVFATLICQINSVFPCKDTKRYSAVCW